MTTIPESIMRDKRPVHPPLRRETDETWKQVIALFRSYGLAAPPVRLRDELVIAFEWAWYGQALEAITKDHGNGN